MTTGGSRIFKRGASIYMEGGSVSQCKKTCKALKTLFLSLELHKSTKEYFSIVDELLALTVGGMSANSKRGGALPPFRFTLGDIALMATVHIVLFG